MARLVHVAHGPHHGLRPVWPMGPTMAYGLWPCLVAHMAHDLRPMAHDLPPMAHDLRPIALPYGPHGRALWSIWPMADGRWPMGAIVACL